eukprot:gene24853-30029_t
MKLIECLSDGILEEFLSEWLGLQDVYNMDMAITHKKLRSHFLYVLKNVSNIRFISSDYMNSTCHQFDTFHCSKVHYVQWLNSRQIRQKLALTFSLNSYPYLNRLLHCFNGGKSYSVVQSLTVTLDHNVPQHFPLAAIFHQLSQVFPLARISLRIKSPSEELGEALLALRDVLNGSQIEGLHVSVIRDYYRILWFFDDDSALLTDFFSTLGSKIRRFYDAKSKFDPARAPSVHLLSRCCPNLTELPYHLNCDTLAAYWQHFQQFKLIETIEFFGRLPNVNGSEECLLDEDESDLQNQFPMFDKLRPVLCVVQTFHQLKKVELLSKDLSGVLHVFRYCQHLEQFNMRACGFTQIMSWEKFGNHDRRHEVSPTLSLDYIMLWVQNDNKVSLETWNVFLRKLSAVLLPLHTLELLWTASVAELNDSDIAQYVVSFCQFLQSSECFRGLQTLQVGMSAAWFLGECGCVFDSVKTLVLSDSENMLLGQIGKIRFAPNVETFHVTSRQCTDLQLIQVREWILSLPRVTDLLVSAESDFVTELLVDTLIEAKRVWKSIVLDCSSDCPQRLFVSAIRERGLLAKKLEVTYIEGETLCLGNGLDVIRADEAAFSCSASEGSVDDASEDIDED